MTRRRPLVGNTTATEESQTEGNYGRKEVRDQEEHRTIAVRRLEQVLVIKVMSSNNRRLGAGGRQVNNLSEGGEKEGTLRRPAGADKENVLEVLHPESAARAGGQEAFMEAPQSS